MLESQTRAGTQQLRFNWYTAQTDIPCWHLLIKNLLHLILPECFKCCIRDVDATKLKHCRHVYPISCHYGGPFLYCNNEQFTMQNLYVSLQFLQGTCSPDEGQLISMCQITCWGGLNTGPFAPWWHSSRQFKGENMFICLPCRLLSCVCTYMCYQLWQSQRMLYCACMSGWTD